MAALDAADGRSQDGTADEQAVIPLERTRYPLDPRTLMVLLVIGSMIPFVLGKLAVWLLLTISSAIYFVFKRRLPWTWIAAAVLCQAAVAAVNASGLFGAVLSFGVLIWAGASLIPTFIVGSVLVSIPSGTIMQALRTLHVPETGLVGVAVALRYLPDVKEQLGQIAKAAKVRGFKLSPLQPVRSFELLIVPLVHRSLRASDDLSASIISKGIEFDGPKTSLHVLRFGAMDAAVVAAYALLLASRFAFGS